MKLTLDLSVLGGLSDNQLYDLCQSNKLLKIERNPDKKLIIMSPTGGESSFQNAEINYQLKAWNKHKQAGVVFDSNGGFILPNGAMRAPDAAWLALDKWQSLTKAERVKFPPVCPNFIIELKSSSDSLKALQQKMLEWIDNGCQLAWLIDPEQERVYCYHADGNISVVNSFDQEVSGDPVLPDFKLVLQHLRVN